MNDLHTYLKDTAQTLAALPLGSLNTIAEALWETYDRDGTIILFGNGGSAATASHFACDLSKWTSRSDRRRMRALALTDNVPLMTAYANDQAYADIFVAQLVALYRPGDLVFAISGSGNSPNVLRPVQWAQEQGAVTVGLCGFDGGKLQGLVQHAVRVNSYLMPQVEDAHSVICHALAVHLGRRMDADLLSLGVGAPRPERAPVAGFR